MRGIVMKVLLIDDEPNALNYLEAMLKPYTNIQILGKYTDVDIAMQHIKKEKIDLIFLDIEMGAFHGIDVARELVKWYPELQIVFVTAYHEFAIDAFEINVVDYLLKPVNTKRLEVTIKRVETKLSNIEEKKNRLLNSNYDFFVTTFGRFHLFDEQQNIIKWRTRKGRELVALLWRNREKPIDKESIIDTLWPNMPFDNALKLLYTTIYQTRRNLKRTDGKSPIKLVGEGYLLQMSIFSDYEELKQLMHAPKNVSNIKGCLALYQDNFLQDYDWALSDRFLLQNEYLLYLDDCIFNNLNVQDPALRQVCLEKRYQVDPLNEKYVLELLESYEETGNMVKMSALLKEYKIRLKELS